MIIERCRKYSVRDISKYALIVVEEGIWANTIYLGEEVKL